MMWSKWIRSLKLVRILILEEGQILCLEFLFVQGCYVIFTRKHPWILEITIKTRRNQILYTFFCY